MELFLKLFSLVTGVYLIEITLKNKDVLSEHLEDLKNGQVFDSKTKSFLLLLLIDVGLHIALFDIHRRILFLIEE